MSPFAGRVAALLATEPHKLKANPPELILVPSKSAAERAAHDRALAPFDSAAFRAELYRREYGLTPDDTDYFGPDGKPRRRP